MPRETMIHVSFQCKFSIEVWMEFNPRVMDVVSAIPIDGEFWSTALRIFEEEALLDSVMVMCWFLWHNRNKWLHEKLCCMRMVLCRSAADFMSSYATTNTNEGRKHGEGNVPVIWEAPPLNWIKVNIDAAYEKNTRLAKLGVVGRDDYGEVAFCVAKAITGVMSPLQTELSAMIFDVEVAKDRGVCLLVLESDCSVGVQEVLKGSASSIPWHSLIYDICSEIASFSAHSFSVVRRTANEVSHNLAKRNMFAGQCFVWDSIPDLM